MFCHFPPLITSDLAIKLVTIFCPPLKHPPGTHPGSEPIPLLSWVPLLDKTAKGLALPRCSKRDLFVVAWKILTFKKTTHIPWIRIHGAKACIYLYEWSLAALNALRVQFGGNLYLLRRYLDP